MKDSTLQKLIEHEKSARSIGNVKEADAYAKKIKEVRANMPKVEDAENTNGKWQCSCGAKISLDISIAGGGKTAKRLADLMLAPHKVFGHRLTKIS